MVDDIICNFSEKWLEEFEIAEQHEYKQHAATNYVLYTHNMLSLLKLLNFMNLLYQTLPYGK